MKPDDYLKKILDGQDLPDDSDELAELEKHRKDVEKLIRREFPDSSITIRYAGSKAKGTLIRESYDLDIASFFAHGDDTGGETLKEIFTNVMNALAKSYFVDPRTCAIRLKSKDDPEESRRDFHIDVLPGRYVDDTKSDCYLHQNGSQKDRLKTNLDVHIAHVKDSGVVPAIRLLKLWRVRRSLRVRNFVFELLIIEILSGQSRKTLSEQLKTVFEAIKAAGDPIPVEDPANPQGNDLTPLLTSDIWFELFQASDSTLKTIENSGWEAVFGPVDSNGNGDKAAKFRQAAAVITPTKPWLPG